MAVIAKTVESTVVDRKGRGQQKYLLSVEGSQRVTE